jgi:dipeptidyl aminopeptidase/acylaminoacyl peptidase
MNTRALALAAALFALGLPTLAFQPTTTTTPTTKPTTTTSKAPSIDRFYRIRAAASPTIAPDGTLFVRDWPDGIWQVFRVQGAKFNSESRPSGKATQITDFKDGAAAYSLSPDGKHMIVMAATGGDENTRIYSVDPNASDASTVKPLLDKPKVQYAPQAWLDDSSGFVYSANDESPNDFHLYRYDFASKASTKLLARTGSWSAPDITTDGARALVSEYLSSSDSKTYELDTTSGNLIPLTILPPNSTAANEIVGYMPGEKSVLLTSDAEGGKIRLYLRDLSGGSSGLPAPTTPIPALNNFEIDSAAISQEKDLLSVVTNEDGFGVLHLYRLPSFQEIPLPDIEPGVIGVNSLRNGHLVFTLNNNRVPGLAFDWKLPSNSDAKAATPRQITFADDQGIDLSAMTLPELVKFKSFDGTEIPAFLYLPAGAQKGKPIPFVCEFHGGPEGQHRPTFSPLTQYLLARGYGVLKPNVRGSTGYGRDFLMMDDYKKRWDSVKDGAESARWLVKQGYANAGKIAAYGGSYGGFMSVATIIEDQSVFGASVDVVGIVNMKTFLEQTSGYRRKLREVEYGPLSDPDFLDSISPIHRADEIQVPMLIAHGLNDPRVPVGEAMQLAEVLQRRALSNPALEPELLFFNDEGHGFQKLENRLLYAERLARFLDRTIGK